MSKIFASAALAATLLTPVLAPAAHAADCNKVIDDLSQAISGNLNISGDKKAAMMRMAVISYDHCMVGDHKHSGEIRDMIMAQIHEHLGGR